MDSLAEETWDLVIAGTGLVQALLALSLSRSNLKILHVDENSYYGGLDAGLSLDEAGLGVFSYARISQLETASSGPAPSRAYTLGLNPQIIYAQSSILPSLVSSTVNSQLEFLAVGSWWIYREGKLKKVPSSREDVFADENLSRRDKVGLMKFLRYVVQDPADESVSQEDISEETLQSVLTSKFKISPDLQLPISALVLSQQSVLETKAGNAVARIRKHMRSIGYFGPGFGAVVAKYAGNAEIAQVCCRACAVGGATYLLGQGISSVTTGKEDGLVEVTLNSGTTVKAKHLVSSLSDLPASTASQIPHTAIKSAQICHSINIISSPLRHFFPQTSENGPIPAVAIASMIESEDATEALTKAPIYFQIHSEDTGECPSGHCIIYASTLYHEKVESRTTQDYLESAVQKLLQASPNDSSTSSKPEVLWSMSYISTGSPLSESPAELFMKDDSGRVLIFPQRTQDIAFDDNILASVKAVWTKILGDAADGVEFLRFEDRSESTGLDDE